MLCKQKHGNNRFSESRWGSWMMRLCSLGLGLWLVIGLVPLASAGKARPLTCEASCHLKLQQSLRWCIGRQHTMLRQCNQWTQDRFRTCSIRSVRVRSSFCTRTLLERRSRCARWTKRRNKRCFIGHRQCADMNKRFCARLCLSSKKKKICINRCHTGRKPRCVRALQECRSKAFSQETFCIAHAKNRFKKCQLSIKGSSHRCKAYATQAGRSCQRHAQTRSSSCKKSAVQRKATCLAACPKRRKRSKQRRRR